MTLDPDDVKRLEADLADRLENTVRKRVIAYFTAMGLFVSGVLGFFGYNVIMSAEQAAVQRGEQLVSDATSSVEARVDTLVDDAQSRVEVFLTKWEDRVAGAVAKSQAATSTSIEASSETLTRIEILDRYLERREERLLDAEVEARKRSASLIQMQSEVGEMQGEVGTRVTEIRESLKTVKAEIQSAQRELLDEITAQTEAQRTRSSEQAQSGREGLSALASGLESLAEQVEMMGLQLVALQDRVSDDVSDTPPDLSNLDQVYELAQSQKIASPESASDPTSRDAFPTVWFQFAGVSRNVVERISEELRRDGYDIPGEERLGSAAGLHEVRYYWDEDADLARRLASDVDRALSLLGYTSGILVRDFTDWQGKSGKPRKNTVELWLEPVSSG